MKDSLAFLQSIPDILLGIGGICAIIAIIVAVLRYFAYEHDEEDTSTLKIRFMHVCGMIAAIGVVVGGGSKLGQQITQNGISNQIQADAGSGFLPDGVQSSTPHYDSMGDLINSFAPDTPDHVSAEEAGDNIQDIVEENKENPSWENAAEDWKDVWLQGQVVNGAAGSMIGGF